MPKINSNRVGDVLVVVFEGLLGAVEADLLREYTAKEFAKQFTARVVQDLRRAVPLVADFPATKDAISSPLSRVPLGLLVTKECLDLALRHAMNMASFTVARLVFTERDEASAWAGVQLPLPELREFQPVSEAR